MNNAEAVNWLINITADIGKIEHQELWHYEQALSEIREMLENAPTIEPRKKGMWIYGESEAGNDGYYCSKCGNFVPWKYDEYDIDFIKEFLFCNKCGADMTEGEG